jgi:hypothetical protein
MGAHFAPEATQPDREQVVALREAEQGAWERIAARRAARLAAEGRPDFALSAAGAAASAGDSGPAKLGPQVVGVRRRDAVNTLARRLAGFTPSEIEGAIAEAGGAVLSQ